MKKLIKYAMSFSLVFLLFPVSVIAGELIEAKCTMVAGPSKGTIQQFDIDLTSGKMNLNGISLNARSLNHLILLTVPGESESLMFFDRNSGELNGDYLGKIGDCEFKNILPLHTQSAPPSVSGKMQCTITGQNVLGSMLGETQEYTGFQGGWDVNDSLELTYSVPSNGDFCLSLHIPDRQPCTNYYYDPDVNPFTALIPSALLKSRTPFSENLVLLDWNHVFSIHLTPDDIRSSFPGESHIRLTQYGDSWDGVFTRFVYGSEKFVQVFTFDCRRGSGDNIQKLTKSMYTKFK